MKNDNSKSEAMGFLIGIAILMAICGSVGYGLALWYEFNESKTTALIIFGAFIGFCWGASAAGGT